MTAPTLLLFDLDETIAPDEETDRAVFAEIAADEPAAQGVSVWRLLAALERAAAARWSTYETAAYCARIGISMWEGLWGPFGASDEPMLAALHRLVPAYRVAVWGAALEACGIQAPGLMEILTEVMAQHFLTERRRRQAAYPWTHDALAGLRGRYRFGMITNGAPDLQRLKLAGTGLADWFDPVVVSGELGVGKPEAAIFAHALALAGGVAPEAAVMIGDSWPRDVLGATSAGLRAVWINARGVPTPALAGGSAGRIAAIPDLRGLAAVVDALA
ncbi:MAG TPA: HAD family hydrolase [Ktedonobacterales bacterium]